MSNGDHDTPTRPGAPATDTLTRREALGAALGGAAAAALAPLAGGCTPDTRPARAEDPAMTTTSPRLPVVYLPHGGGPWPFVDVGFGAPDELAQLASYLRSLSAVPAVQPRALLVVSAHWEEPVPTVMTSPSPPMLYDYHGFPPESYTLTWPAPGDPALAARVRRLLEAAGFPTAEDPSRGFDHGTFVPLKLAYPKADIPTVQLSLRRGLDPSEHIALGRALAPLREEGVFIVGSGMSYHNLRAFGPAGRGPSAEFDAWLGETIALPASARADRLARWAAAPSARFAHPREEHLLPLMVVAGAAVDDPGRTSYTGTLLGLRLSAYHFG